MKHDFDDFDNLPDNVKAQCYFNVETKEITLWDEMRTHVVCVSHYPEVIKAAMDAYITYYHR